MATTYTIQDITNPDLTYEERARLRKERRLKLGGSVDLNLGKLSPSRPFRTHSPTVDPSLAPTLGFPSEYAYIASLSPRGSPSPSRKPCVTSPTDASLKIRALSEPVDLESRQGDENNEVSSFQSFNDEDLGFPGHISNPFPYDSRTPRLTRGALKKSNIVYRKDLDDFNKQDITIVMFPRDATLDRQHERENQHQVVSQRKVSDDNTAKKKGMVIVPSASQTTVSDVRTDSVAEITEETKNEGAGKQRKLSKTFSFLSKKEKGERKKSVKEKKKVSSAEKKLSSGGLSGISMPNLHSPNSEEPLSPEAQGTKMRIFRRKQDKKSNVQRTSWTFQQPNPESIVPLQPAMSLQNIAESPTDLPTYEMVASDRTGSMEHIPHFCSDDLNAPVTVFGSRRDDEDDDVDRLPMYNETMYCPGYNAAQGRSPSPMSIGSISIDIPDLPDSSKPVTPLPTLNDITCKPSERKMDTSSQKGNVVDTKPQRDEDTPKSIRKKDMPKNKEEDTPRSMRKNDDTPMNTRKEDMLKSTGESTPKSTRKEDVPKSTGDETPKSMRKEDMPKTTGEDTPKATRKEDMPKTTGEDTPKTTGEDTPTGNTTDTATADVKNFKRNLGSRKPLRKPSLSGKDSPNLKKRYSSMRATPESPVTDRSISTSPSASSLKSDSPRTTPTINRKNVTKSPTSRIVEKGKMTTQSNGISTNSPNRFTPSPIKTTAKGSPSSSPLSSPVLTNKAKKVTKSPLTTPTGARKFKKLSQTSPNAARKNQQEPKSSEHKSSGSTSSGESSRLVDSPMTRKRRLGITSITSPLSEEKQLGITQPHAESAATKSKIIPKRPAPKPPEKSRTPGSEMDSNLNKSPPSPISGDKSMPKVSTPVAKRNSVPSNEKTSKGTYVYQSRHRKSQQSPPPPPVNKESQTYKYTTGSLGKKSSLPATITATTTKIERLSGRSKLVVSDSQKKLSTPNMKISSIDGGLKPPSIRNQTKSSSSLIRRQQQKLSLVETGSPREILMAAKSNSEDIEEKTSLQKKEETSTLDILKPLDSILSLSTDKLSKEKLSSPPIESMLARPFSPTSPQLSQEEGDISLTPEVPMDQDDEMTFIYRSTLLRKTSCGTGKQISRTSSNKSIGFEGTKTSFSRTSSPKKISSGSPSRQSKKSSSGSPFRKGSTILSSSRKGSTTQTLSRRPSSGIPREKTGSSSTLGRPRSASQINMYPSLKRSSRSSMAAPTSALARQSIKNKKTSADSVNTKKPPSGLQSSKRSHPNFSTKATNDCTDGKPTTTSSSTPESTAISVSKPKSIVKAHSSTDFDTEKSSNIRKSVKLSKSYDCQQKPKPDSTKSNFLKPPSGSTLGRSSSKQKISTESPLQNRVSIRMSRRSSAGTVKKVSQSNSPIHTATKTSPGHRTLTRTLKKEDTVDDFEYISSMANKTKLSSVADHKRQVRPRTKYRPSPGHLQMLSQRKDVSSEFDTAAPNNNVKNGVDINAYSTYMGKKNLDKTALAGLAAKLDFTTVQLRKTGIVEQMMSDNVGGGTNKHRLIDDAQNSYGVQMTSHLLMLIMIKGRKNLQTRLVEPTAMSINSGDVFILVGEKDLFLWQGKEANVLEKARANDVVNRIHQKRELGCRASGYTHLDDEGTKKDLPRKYQQFWELLKGKPTMKKDINLVPSDEMYEKGVSCATKVYQFVMEGEVGKFVAIHEDSAQPLKIALLDTKKVLLFDFCSEVYVWMGKRCPQNHRKASMIKARKHYDNGYIPPVFSNTSSPKKIAPTASRQSGRFHSKLHQRHGTLSGSMRRKTLERKPSKGILQDRPPWALFARVNEGSETILFREKFADWPEPGRIIKMRGHESSGEVVKPPPMPELQPADVHQMLKPRSKFEGMRLEGENIHRGHGNYKVSRSTFACNRVRSEKIEKYLVKDSDNILLPEKSHGIFYSGEGYVFRWKYVITVVRELEGLTPGEGMFAKDRKYQKDMQKKQGDENVSTKATKEVRDDDSSDEEVDESDDESKRVLESGGRDRVAYFFWQGEHASINEKGAAAVITVEMDKERAPQIRVTQGKEHPTFLQLFKGTMVVLLGKSERNSIDVCPRGYRIYAVQGNAKKEACLVEIEVKNHPLFYYTRSRGCYIIQHKALSTVFIWIGSKATETLKGVAALAARNLKRRLDSFKVVKVMEGAEPKELNNLMGARTLYHSLLTSQKPLEYTPRLFHLSSSTGWFLATEEIHVSMPDSTAIPDPFPFLQEDLYNAVQPGLFLLDADTDIYLWMGWWPVQRNKLLQEKNAFSGLAQSRWAKDKKLALETAMMYAEGCKRTPIPTVYVVNAGTEHIEFTNLFPIWNERKDVQEIVGSTMSTRSLAEKELAKYNKTNYTLKELLKRPEEVDASKLETYLSDEEFEQIFKMPRDQFSKMLLWKQVDLKKKVGLF